MTVGNAFPAVIAVIACMNASRSINALLRKYDVPTPRYTSFPAVPHWNMRDFSGDQWTASVRKSFEETNMTKGISLYVHLPFCESLCTYCACTTRITRNHDVEGPYAASVLQEWMQYRELFDTRPIIREIHIGGGTPTFFSPGNLATIIKGLLRDSELHADHCLSFEGHPNNTDAEHLSTLFELGFRRVSFGVQDFEPRVQAAIRRIQPVENVERVVKLARRIGYKSIAFDLIYGLPHQNPFTVSDTIDHALRLRPDRIAFYSYAHVPWLKPGQRGYDVNDLPSASLKRHFYEIGKHKLTMNGYADIGMDHFALPTDDLFKAHIAGRLHRNFMGYVTHSTDLLIGLGASAISESGSAYAQNDKTVEDYTKLVARHSSAVKKGHMLSLADRLIRKCILQLSCRGELEGRLLDLLMTPQIEARLREMEEEGLVYLHDDGLTITHAGHPFIRNICSVFDPYFQQRLSSAPAFSNAI